MRQARLAVDNTFATPYRSVRWPWVPIFVVHSTTKYLGGHSDVVGGALVRDDDLHRGWHSCRMRQERCRVRSIAGWY